MLWVRSGVEVPLSAFLCVPVAVMVAMPCPVRFLRTVAWLLRAQPCSGAATLVLHLTLWHTCPPLLVGCCSRCPVGFGMKLEVVVWFAEKRGTPRHSNGRGHETSRLTTTYHKLCLHMQPLTGICPLQRALPCEQQGAPLCQAPDLLHSTATATHA